VACPKRRKLSADIDQLEESIERAREAARHQVSDDLQADLRFQLDKASKARESLQKIAANV